MHLRVRLLHLYCQGKRRTGAAQICSSGADSLVSGLHVWVITTLPSVSDPIIEATVFFRIILHSVRRNLGEFKPFFNILHLPRIGQYAEPDADPVCDVFPGKHIGQEFFNQLLVVLLMRAV